MSGFPILDLVLGMVFIYFLLSIITSSLVEVVLSSFKIRSRVLGKWLLTIFDKKMMRADGGTEKLAYAIMNHCATTALAKPGKATSFMDARNFVSSLIEKLNFDPNDPHNVDNIPKDLREMIDVIRNAKAIDGTSLLPLDLQRTFIMYANEARSEYEASTKNLVQGISVQSDLQIFRKKLEGWFDSSMDRVQGHMKTKYVRPITFVLALIIVVSVNADSIRIARFLYASPSERTNLAVQAMAAANDTTYAAIARNPTDTTYIKTLAVLKDTGIPLGWGDKEHIRDTKPSVIAGWMMSVLAIMLGAPFWFDLLNKISNIRGAGTKPPSSTEKEKKEKT